VTSIERLDGWEDARPDWIALGERSGSIFATWEWADAWREHLGGGATPVFHRAVRDGSTVALVPLVEQRRGPLRILRFVGHGPSDELGPVHAAGDREAGARALASALEAARWHVFLGERLDGDGDWPRTLGRPVLRHEASPVIRLDGGWDDYLATRSRNHRGNVRRAERQLAEQHDVVFRLADAGSLHGDLDTLIALHRLRWGAGSSAFEGGREAFHRAFAAVALDRGWLRLWTLELDGTAVAAWYGFRFGDAEWFYQSGRDPAWDRESVGTVLLAHTIRSAVEDGVPCYRLLRGDEGYKARFATADPGLDTIAVGRGALGRGAIAAANGVARLPTGLRGRVAARLR